MLKLTFYVCVCVCAAPAAIALLTVLGVLALVALMTSMLCLHYTGFLCRLKALLPGALVVRTTQSASVTR